MRPFRDMTVFQIPSDRSETDIRISELRQMFNSGCSRLPVVDHENRPLYMIHESMVDHHIASGNTEEDTLDQFINQQREGGFSFKVNAGFVIASEKATIISAKQKMENLPSCQDIFITKEGSSDEPLSGWISNVRLAKFMNM